MTQSAGEKVRVASACQTASGSEGPAAKSESGATFTAPNGHKIGDPEQ
jgi:hypothetical protein